MPRFRVVHFRMATTTAIHSCCLLGMSRSLVKSSTYRVCSSVCKAAPGLSYMGRAAQCAHVASVNQITTNVKVLHNSTLCLLLL